MCPEKELSQEETASSDVEAAFDCFPKISQEQPIAFDELSLQSAKQ